MEETTTPVEETPVEATEAEPVTEGVAEVAEATEVPAETVESEAPQA